MNVHILGAGSMGCLWAAHLELSSTQVTNNNSNHPPLKITFISTRTPHAESINFKLESSFLDNESYPCPIEFSFPIKKLESSDKAIDCILVCTKSFDAVVALKSSKNYISEDTQIVLYQNGLGSQFEVINLFPHNPIYAAVTTEGSNRPRRNIVVHAGKGTTTIGALNKSARSQQQLTKLKTCLNLPHLNSMLTIDFHLDIWQALWQKLVINCAINPFTAILDCPNGEVPNTPLFKKEWPQLKVELLELLKLAGYPINEEKIDGLVLEVMHKTRSNISSMLQDIRANKLTEIEDICGFAFRYLEENNISSPTLKYLYKEVQLKSKK